MGTFAREVQQKHASKERDVGGAPHHDPVYEFCAPMFYDFQRLNDNVPSPASQGEAYFESSKTKGKQLHKARQLTCSRKTSTPLRCAVPLQS